MNWKAIKNIGGADEEWFYLKLSLPLVSLPVLTIMLFSFSGCPYPTGICKLYSFAPLFSPVGQYIFYAAFLLLSLLYLFEIKMVLATGALFLCNVIIISHHESNGVFYRATILSTIFGAQFIAYVQSYFKSGFHIRRFRINYSIQIIAATYTLAAIAKLRASGLSWINSDELFSLQVMKNYAFLYFDTGSKAILEQGKTIAYSLLKHKGIIRFFLAAALALELFCFAAIIGKKIRLAFGVGLLAMHIGIMYVFGIGMGVIANPMVVFFINPLYLFKRLIVFIYGKTTTIAN